MSSDCNVSQINIYDYLYQNSGKKLSFQPQYPADDKPTSDVYAEPAPRLRCRASEVTGRLATKFSTLYDYHVNGHDISNHQKD